jgi:hypothetical protein
MPNNLKKAFKSAMLRSVAELGYTMNSDTMFAKVLSPRILGCIGYLTSKNDVTPLVGVYFEQVEEIFEDIFEPLRAIPKSTPRYYPTLSRRISELKQDRSGAIEQDYFRVELNRVEDITHKILVDVQRFGLEYIEANSNLSSAAETMASRRGGGMGWVSARLPIIYWMLGRTSEAKSYMAHIAAQKYPIGDYEQYAALLTARMESEPTAKLN